MAKNKKVIKAQKKYQNLQERYEQMNDYLLDLIEDHRCAKEDLKCLNDFIHYKKLDEEFHLLMSTQNWSTVIIEKWSTYSKKIDHIPPFP